MSVKRDILNALVTRLQTQCTWATEVVWERIRLHSSDFDDHEVPIIQVYSGRRSAKHQKPRTENAWTIFVEVVCKQTQAGVVDLRTLMDHMESVEQAVGGYAIAGGGDANLAVPQMMHMALIGDDVGLAVIDPYYYGVLEFQALYFNRYTGC